MNIIFTKHAKEKFVLLARHGLKIDKNTILVTVQNPKLIDYNRLPLLIAQSDLSRNNVLRVVYKIEGDKIKIITFYPGRKSQYEK